MSKSTLKELLTNTKLRSLAGSRSYNAGKTYFEDEAVERLLVDQEAISALVQGSKLYRVHLKASNGKLDYDCSCPFAEEGAFCKHCVATGLAWLDEEEHPEKRKTSVTMADVREFLMSQAKEKLTEMILDLAMRDANLQNQLFLRIAQSGPGGPDLEALRNTIDEAVVLDYYVDYDEAREYAEGLVEIESLLKGLLDDGHTEAVIELAEYAIEGIEGSQEELGSSHDRVFEIRTHLEHLHHDACRMSPPEPETLARKLFDLEMNSEYAFSGALQTYSDVLGERGIAAYRQVVEEEWNVLPALKPGDQNHDARRHRLTQMMESLVSQSGSLEELVEIKTRDLSDSSDFAQIATIYLEAGREKDAIEWAERGKTAFPNLVEGSLADLLISLYRDRGEHEKSLEILWKRFQDRPYLQSFQPLKAYTEPIGQWPNYRKKALDVIRDNITKKSSTSRSVWGAPSDSSSLVEILLWDGAIDEAWHTAQEGGCSETLWMQLAAARAATHPNDALDIYQKAVIRAIESTTGDYSYPIELLNKMRAIFKKHNRMDEFQAEIEQLRINYKRKINFIKALKAFV